MNDIIELVYSETKLTMFVRLVMLGLLGEKRPIMPYDLAKKGDLPFRAVLESLERLTEKGWAALREEGYVPLIANLSKDVPVTLKDRIKAERGPMPKKKPAKSFLDGNPVIAALKAFQEAVLSHSKRCDPTETPPTPQKRGHDRPRGNKRVSINPSDYPIMRSLIKRHGSDALMVEMTNFFDQTARVKPTVANFRDYCLRK